MTLIRRDERSPFWNSLLNEFFNQERNDLALTNYSETNTTLPSINIKESENGFDVEMAAPGMDKEDFKLEVDKGILAISSEKKIEPTQEECDRYTRREFSYQSFYRSFSLPNSVDTDKIEAKYEKGILTVSIPKKEEAKPKPIRVIDIK